MTLSDGRRFLEYAHETNRKKLEEELSKILPKEIENLKTSSSTVFRNRLIVALAASEIAKLANARLVVYTARTRSGLKGNLLHPVSTFPSRLNEYFLNPNNYRSFQFDSNAFNVSGEAGEPQTAGLWMARAYKIAALPQYDGQEFFSGRIRSFLDNVENHRDQDDMHYGVQPSDLQGLRQNGICMVFGGRAAPRPTFRPMRQNESEFDYFFSLYFLPSGEEEVLSADGILARLAEIGNYLNYMFRALDLSSRHDEEAFELEGFELVSKLIPELGKHDTAPSDAISFFLKEMADIMRKHTLGVDDPRHTWVRFVAVDTVFTEEEGMNVFYPRFKVFPRSEVSDPINPDKSVAAFLLSHPLRLATVKIIAHHWAETHGSALAKDFKKTFTLLTQDELKAIKAAGGSEAHDYVYLSSDDPGVPWDKININVTEGQKNTQCTLGFVISTADRSKIPYAIVAFESDIPDAFSSRDVNRLGQFISACTGLFRNLKVSSAGLDLLKSIRSAFIDESTRPPIIDPRFGTEIEFGMFKFELLRLDAKLLSSIINSDQKSIWEGSGLSKAQAAEWVLAPLRGMPGADDEAAADQERQLDGPRTYNVILRKRATWIEENEVALHTKWTESRIAADIYDFLTNIPSNIVWHCYLNAIPRAVADRTGSDEGLRRRGQIRFKSLQHGGRSALGMFAFTAEQQEFRQIIKLSDRKRIDEEAENYRKYVRYSVPLSARLPFLGKAIEGDGDIRWTLGEHNQPNTSQSSYGALVSDLIAGGKDEERPITLLDRVIELVDGAPHRDTHDIPELLEAVKYQFDHNVRRWQGSDRPWHKDTESIASGIRSITRVRDENAKHSSELIRESLDEHKKFSELAIRLLGDHSDLVQRLKDYESSAGNLDGGLDGINSIIHGDLNCRNLVWSRDYLKFFMIDFERTKPGFYGADQLRLSFSLVCELSSEFYRKENFGIRTSIETVERHCALAEKVADDAGSGIHYLSTLMKNMQTWRAAYDEARPQEPQPTGLTSRVVGAALDDKIFSKGNPQFWSFAIIATGIKELEYALRDVDRSCIKVVEHIMNTPATAGRDRFNFYNYYDGAYFTGVEHDKIVFAKVSRAIFAYRLLDELLMPNGSQGHEHQ